LAKPYVGWGILGILLWIVDSYLSVYGTGPFFVAVATGLIAGFLLSNKERPRIIASAESTSERNYIH